MGLLNAAENTFGGSNHFAGTVVSIAVTAAGQARGLSANIPSPEFNIGSVAVQAKDYSKSAALEAASKVAGGLRNALSSESGHTQSAIRNPDPNKTRTR